MERFEWLMESLKGTSRQIMLDWFGPHQDKVRLEALSDRDLLIEYCEALTFAMIVRDGGSELDKKVAGYRLLISARLLPAHLLDTLRQPTDSRCQATLAQLSLGLLLSHLAKLPTDLRVWHFLLLSQSDAGSISVCELHTSIGKRDYNCVQCGNSGGG